MGELSSPIAEYAEEFHRQDQKAIQTMQRVTSLETHQFGKHNVKQTYICDKFPLCDENNDCIGIFFHMYKTQLDEEKISEELMISLEDVANHIQSIYQKFNLPLHAELKDFCKENKLYLYIPERFVTIGSRELS